MKNNLLAVSAILLSTYSVALALAAEAATSSKILRSSVDYDLLEIVPHDTSSFTQGLTYFDGHIYEGTGLEQQSSLMKHDPTNQMRTLKKIPITPSHLFGEGISHYYVWTTDEYGNQTKEHRLIQLTWKNKVGKIYSLPDMELIKEFTYNTVTGEGWGITFVPHTNEFYVSDGSEYLMIWDATTLEEKRRIIVTFDRGQGNINHVKYLNELEFVDFAPASQIIVDEGQQCSETTCSDNGFTSTMKILANVWYQDVLISIDPDLGKVSRVYDLRDIYPHDEREKHGSDCLNGISVTGKERRDPDELLEVWVTGKLWPKMFRIQLRD